MVVMGMAATSFAGAQNMQRDPKSRPTEEQVAQRMAERMTQELSLTPEQQKQVYDVQLDQIRQMKAHRDAMRAERQGEASRMKDILTAEQYERWVGMQGPHRGRHNGHRGPKCDKPCGGCPVAKDKENGRSGR